MAHASRKGPANLVRRYAGQRADARLRRHKVRKRVYFDVFRGPGWPSPSQLESYFLAPPGQRWTFDTGNDNWSLAAEGVDGTEHLKAGKDRIDVDLEMWGHPELGVLLIYSKWGGGFKENHSSKGNLSLLQKWV